MTELSAGSWDDALRHLYADSWQQPLRRFRSTLAFRGVARTTRSLDSGIARIAADPAAIEQHLLRNFRKYARQQPDARFDSIWHWLAVAQHHGLPTRLLDWTYSPLVALHFVTEDSAWFDEDGVVWAIDYVAAKQVLPRELQDTLDDESCDVFTPELLSEAVHSLEELQASTSDPALVFLEPPSLDERIVTQYALFSLMTDPTATLDDWIARHGELCRRMVIPARVKWEIRDKLDQANVTERVLYPGLDGLCKWLARYYQER